MLISSIISGINVAVKKQVESFGTRSIFLYKMDIGIRTSQPTREERMRKPLTMEDAEAVRNLSSIELAVPFLDISNNFFGQKILVTGKNGKTSSAVQLNGTLPDIEKSTTEVLLEGRWFTQSESDNKADVCLIGSSVVENYFPYGSPVGETLEIGGREFRVIGTLEKKEQLFGGGGGNNDQSNTIYMPMGAALRLKPYADDLFILAVAREGMLEKAKDDVQDLLRVRRAAKFGEPNNFAMETAASLIRAVSVNYGWRSDCDGRYFFSRSDDRRYRRDEYYARFRHRTNQRNRHPQSHRRKTIGYSAAISDRSRDFNRIRRFGRFADRLGFNAFDRPRFSFLCSAGGRRFSDFSPASASAWYSDYFRRGKPRDSIRLNLYVTNKIQSKNLAKEKGAIKLRLFLLVILLIICLGK